MSPAVTAAYPALLDIFGGSQSARTIQFFAFAALVLFLVVHVAMVVLTGFKRQMRVETQLGYKSVKFIERIVVKDEFDDLGKIGSLQNGWAWYVGI